jgi:RNA polymerase sigma factor (sigma-70 family)
VPWLDVSQSSTGRADAEMTHALILLARDGDRTAFGHLYAANVVAIQQYARRLVWHEQAADDLVAEAFLRTWIQLLAGGGPDRFFRAYVRTAVLNLHVTHLHRSERLDLVPDVEVAVVVAPGIATRFLAASPEDVVMVSVVHARLMEALLMLPQRWQTVLVMVYLEDVPYTDVSGTLGLTVDATRHLSMRARAGFRRALTTLHERDGEEDALSAMAALAQLHECRLSAV